MAKWADYGISAVRYNNEKTHIAKVKVHEDRGDTVGVAVEWSRTRVASTIEEGESFVTILRNDSGKWRRGQDVHVVTVNGVKYIRTDQNWTASDNLENLPEY